MVFRPEVGESITLNRKQYRFTKHPAVFGIDIPYGQEGRQGIVYQLQNDQTGEKIALKVFKNRYREEKHKLEFLNTLSKMTGFQVGSRYIVTKSEHAEVIEISEDLVNAIVMPWIHGPTWADILQEQRPLGKQDCFKLMKAFLKILKKMEDEQLAHNDLSSSNILIPYLTEEQMIDQYIIELVDIEQMYGPKIERPSLLPAGSAGYAPIYLQKGVWQKEADRFSGAILLSEMLAWCDEDIRKQKWADASYFKAEEMQTSCERYNLLLHSLQTNWGTRVTSLLQQAWESNRFEECPSFTEWHEVLSDLEEVIEHDKETSQQVSNSVFLSKCLEIARLFEEKGMPQAALYEYTAISSLEHVTKALKEELKTLIESLQEQPHQDNKKSILQCYLELATQLELENHTSMACFAYKRIMQFPNLDQALVSEIQQIIKELESKEENGSEQLAASLHEKVPNSILQNRKKKNNQVDYDIDDEILNAKPSNQPLTLATYEQETEPSSFVKWWRKNKRNIIIVGSTFLVIGGGGFAYYLYSTNTKYQAYMENGRKAYASSNYKVAEENVVKALTVKEKGEAYLQLATIYIAEGKNKIAIDYLTKLVKDREIDETNKEMLYLLASANFRIKNYKEAVPYYEKVINEKGQDIGAYESDAMRDLAVSLMKIGEFEKAEDTIVKMKTETTKEKATVSYLKGQLCEVTGQLDKAEKFLKEAIQLDQKKTTYYIELSNLYVLWNKTNLIDSSKKEKNYQEAIQYLDSAITKNKQDVELLNQLGTVYYEFGQFYETRDAGKGGEVYKQALHVYNELLNLGIRDSNVLVNLGILHDKTGQGTEADRYFAEALAKNDEDPHVNFIYGMFKIKQKQYEDASRFLKKTVQANENEAEVKAAQEKLAELKSNGWIQ
ncbi:tetratricopeptide repeat protein [Bacillus sp. NPDC094106]|uniref:tetratricopeptide repeat protein n=1 Tax=Bacillus sp. NPDC094106 TaxID=3363949 RepID=UPI003826206E